MNRVFDNALSACIAPMKFQQLAGINILSFCTPRILIPPILFKFYFVTHLPSNSLCQLGA